jgi:hypothetical protein
MTPAALDRLVLAGLLTGYTIEEDVRHLEAAGPTLTYRMYAEGAASHLNVGAFASAMARLGAGLRMHRVVGTLGVRDAQGRHLHRSRQLCVEARFESAATVEHALGVVRSRFLARTRGAVAGSWFLPDARITGVSTPPDGAVEVVAHSWPAERGTAVCLSLSPEPPLPAADTHRIAALGDWLAVLEGAAPARVAAMR